MKCLKCHNEFNQPTYKNNFLCLQCRREMSLEVYAAYDLILDFLLGIEDWDADWDAD